MKLSVLIMTYNQEKYIAQAIESALMQDVDFDYEILVGDDCSKDRTCLAAAYYERKYPEKVRVLCSDRNIGGNRNFARILKQCRGEYVAILDGDDYWTSRNKLRRQIDLLDSHKECVICFHDVRSVWEDNSRPSSVLPLMFTKEISTLEDLLSPGSFMPNSSVIFRNHLVDEIPEWLLDLPMGDWPFHVLVARFGKMGYIREVMSVYRRHSSSVLLTRHMETFWRSELRMYDCLRRCLDRRYTRYLRVLSSRRYHVLSVHWEEQGNWHRARSYALRRLTACPCDRVPELPIRHLARLCIPRRFYGIAKRTVTAILRRRANHSRPAAEDNLRQSATKI